MINRIWKERILELERKIMILEDEKQKRDCKENKHMPGQLMESGNIGEYYVRCPACWKNLTERLKP